MVRSQPHSLNSNDCTLYLQDNNLTGSLYLIEEEEEEKELLFSYQKELLLVLRVVILLPFSSLITTNNNLPLKIYYKIVVKILYA